MQQAMVESGEAPILYCEPPEPLRSELIDFAARQFQGYFREMPPTYSTFELDEEIQNPDDVLLLKERIRTIRAFTMGGWLLSAALLGLIMVLVIRSWRDVSIWWGIPIFVAGILTIALVFSANTFVDRVMQESIVEGSEALYDLLRLPVSAVREKVSGEVMGMGFVVSVVGMGILVISYLFHRAVRPAVEYVAGNVHYNEIASPPPYPSSDNDAPPTGDTEGGERPSGLFG